jgi:hypothetical protein
MDSARVAAGAINQEATEHGKYRHRLCSVGQKFELHLYRRENRIGCPPTMSKNDQRRGCAADRIKAGLIGLMWANWVTKERRQTNSKPRDRIGD